MITLLLAFVLLITAPLARADLEVEEVLLYRSGATVISKGVIYVHPGKNLAGFIPADADRNSIKIAANCDAASIVGMDLADPSETEKYKEIRNKIRILEAKLARFKDREDFYRKLIDSLAAAYKNNRYLNYLPYEKKYQELENRMLVARQKKNQILEEIEKAKKELKKLDKKKALYLVADGEDQCEITVSYETSKASWYPEYTAVYQNSSLTLTLKAIIEQNTEEDWKKVSISLASEPPSRVLSVPQISPWYVRVLQIFMGMAPKAAPSRAPARMAQVETTLQKREIGFSYVLNQEADIPSGRQVILSIKRFVWKKVELQRLCYPSVSRRVYAKVDVPLPPEPLPLGNVKVFLNNTYLGKTNIKTLLEKKVLEIPFGADPDIEVQADTDINRESTWSGKNRLLITRVISLSNAKDKQVKITLKEPLPVSKDERVKVKMKKEDFNPAPDSIDKRGIATWNLTIPPGETKKIIYKFSIEYPTDTNINIIY